MPDTLHVGDLEVTCLSDGWVSRPPTDYFFETSIEQWRPHARWLDHAGNLSSPFGCFLIRAPERLILIDTGLGPIERPPWHGGQLLRELASVGVRPGDVHVVFITHLHADHCGTAALAKDGAMVPTFPNATYRWTAAEQLYWSGELPPETIARRDVFAAVLPQFSPADDGEQLARGVHVYAMPGHTPGHAGVVLSSGADRAFLLGDAIACPVQLEEPEWSGISEVDAKLARHVQDAVLREAESTGARIGASHFPGLTLGRVLRGEGRRYWQPV